MFKTDKLLHFSFSYMIISIIYIVDKDLVTSSIFTLLIGILKEVCDYSFKGTKFDVDDLTADAIGVVLFVSIILLGRC